MVSGHLLEEKMNKDYWTEEEMDEAIREELYNPGEWMKKDYWTEEEMEDELTENET